MLRVNVQYMSSTEENFEKCYLTLLGSLEQLQQSCNFLKSQTSLEDELISLENNKKRLEQDAMNIKKLINVINLAAKEYESCEADITKSCDVMAGIRNQARFKEIKFNMNYANVILWR